MTIYVYTMFPIDFGWEHLKSFDDYVSDEAKAHRENKAWTDQKWQERVGDLMDFQKTALRMAEYCTGNFTAGPSVTFLPHNDDPELQMVMLWKICDNGTTFAASNKPIMHLEEDGDLLKREVAK